MHRGLFIALAGLMLGTGVYAANTTSTSQRQDQPAVQSSQNSNTGSDMSGQSQPNMPTTNRPYYNTGADAGTARAKGSRNPNDTSSGSAAGGYVAAGIGIAALIGLFASRRGRDTTTRRDDHRDDDIYRPGGPTTRM